MPEPRDTETDKTSLTSCHQDPEVMLTRPLAQSHSKCYINMLPQPLREACTHLQCSWPSPPRGLCPSTGHAPGALQTCAQRVATSIHLHCRLFSERKKGATQLIPAPFLSSRTSLNSVLSHLHHRRRVTHPLARRPIAQYWSISCWHFL